MIFHKFTKLQSQTPFNGHMPDKPGLKGSLLILYLQSSLSWASSWDSLELYS